jgi:hypothetical protein
MYFIKADFFRLPSQEFLTHIHSNNSASHLSLAALYPINNVLLLLPDLSSTPKSSSSLIRHFDKNFPTCKRVKPELGRLSSDNAEVSIDVQ